MKNLLLSFCLFSLLALSYGLVDLIDSEQTIIQLAIN